MFELWIMVVGGESDEERVIATGGFDVIESAIEEHEDEVAHGYQKYFSIVEQRDGEEFNFEDLDTYYEEVKPQLERKFSLARFLGERLLPRNF